MTNPYAAFAISFAAAALIKTAVYLQPLPRRVLAALLATAITHPIVWFIFPRVWPAGHVETMVLCSQIFAVAIEGAYLASFSVKRPLVWALMANALSFCAALLLRRYARVG